MGDLFSPTFTLMEKALNGAALRHELLSNNLANVNTPGFKRSDLDFASYLASAMDGQERLQLRMNDFRHLAGNSSKSSKPFVHTDNQSSARQDGNNVNPDVEMVRLSENSMKFNVIAQQINKAFFILRTIAQGK